jgi:hypothetical protein
MRKQSKAKPVLLAAVSKACETELEFAPRQQQFESIA